jgi:hypothetical protein
MVELVVVVVDVIYVGTSRKPIHDNRCIRSSSVKYEKNEEEV